MKCKLCKKEFVRKGKEQYCSDKCMNECEYGLVDKVDEDKMVDAVDKILVLASEWAYQFNGTFGECDAFKVGMKSAILNDADLLTLKSAYDSVDDWIVNVTKDNISVTWGE